MASRGRSILSPEDALLETYFEHVFVSKTLPAQMTLHGVLQYSSVPRY